MESEELLENMAGAIGLVIFSEVDASVAISNSGRYIENNRERSFGMNMGASDFSVIRQPVLR